MRTIKSFVMIFMGMVSMFIVACKKDDKTPTVPELTTTPVTAVNATTASSGGTITSNGGETISASGVCWSSTNANPTINDDTTRSTTSSGSFTAMLNNLTPSTTYYVRAYAINRVGTGYGNVVTFSSGNGAPVATNISITGTPEVSMTLTATYTYSDPEGDAEAGTSFRWFMADDAAGTNETAITGATEKTYTLEDAQQGKYVRVGITAKAAAGTSPGTEVKSSFVGAVGDATTVTFMYNGTEVTYGIISSASGKKWLDRNLGATRVAQSVDDYQAYGDMFQWGRLADGHQLVTRTGPGDADVTGVTGITSTTAPYETSSTDVPSTNKFIIENTLKGDWRIPQNSNLWQGVNGINNPCPAGWRIPTKEEWAAEGITSGTNAYSKLKLTYSGFREFSTGNVLFTDYGIYWTSSVDETYPDQLFSNYVYFDATSFDVSYTNRGNGQPCRCIKD